MFSFALFKQSWKANGLLWLVTTIVSTFVLIIIMSLTGGEGLVSLTSSFAETVVYEELSSSFESSVLNYYSIGTESLEEFDRAFLEGFYLEIQNKPGIQPTEEDAKGAYIYAIDKLNAKADSLIELVEKLPEDEEIIYLELLGSVYFALNPNEEFSETYEEFEANSAPNPYDIEQLVSEITPSTLGYIWLNQAVPENYYDIVFSKERDDYRKDRTLYSNAIFLAGNMSTEEAILEILSRLDTALITREVYDGFGFDYDNIKYIARSALLTYQARYDYEMSLANTPEEKEAAILELKQSITANFITSLPESIRNVLVDMEEQDLYASTLVSMYYKIVGLLISIIYIIMASVNLISGQVDSGSMAYVLSTGTKREQVAFTQGSFLVSSSFLMYLTTTAVSVIVFQFATPVASAMNVGRLLLFGLGTFLVSYAFIGINFLTSCIFNRSRQSMAIGGGVTLLMLICTILGMFGSNSMPAMMRMEALNVFNYFSLISLIDSYSILDGTTVFIWKFAILAAVGIITSVIGTYIFKKKDLPL